ncbi:MAG TPA: sialidase family protein [Gemmatimonadaceae bacterium]
MQHTFLPVALVFLAVSCKETESPPARPFAPGEPTLLSVGSPTKDEDPSVLLARDGTILVAWFSDRGGNPDVYISSTRNGRDWTAPVRVTTNAGGDFYPNLYQDDAGRFHLTWFRWTAPFVGHIMYNTSADGLTWDAGNEIQATKAPNVDDWVPTITVKPDGTVLIYFVSKLRNTSNQQNDLYLAMKRSGMADFDAVVGASGINVPAEHDHLPFVARTGSTYTLVWTRYDLSEETPWLNAKSDLYYATSPDGTSWTSPTKITSDVGNVVNLFPALYATLDQSWRLLWLSTRSGPAQPFETPIASLGQYSAGVVASTSLPPGYSHRIAPTPVAGTYIGVWVQGPDGSQDIYYRIFQR